MSAPGHEATGDYSNSAGAPGPAPRTLGPWGSLAAGLGIAGAATAIAATFTTIVQIRVLTVTPARYTGFDRHSVALLLLGAFGLLMVAGAARGARPAMAALAMTGLAVLLIAVLVDLPDLDNSGVWPLADSYEDARASAGVGWYLETASGVLMLVAGVSLWLLAPRPRRARRPRGEPASAPHDG